VGDTVPVDDPRIIAHWKLDEHEGLVARESVGGHDGIVQGDPLWWPDGGMIQGALELDGTNDYVRTPFVLSPADGPFSIFAWVKGGAPGQVVISQGAGTDWLSADPSDGWLMTDLKYAGRGGKALVSDAIITDGHWHHVGLVWDGSNRILYVDNIEVARDTQGTPAGPTEGLYIGCGKNVTPGTFWSGLIDDVRIYNRAVSP